MAILYGCTLTVAHVFGVFISLNIFEKSQFKPIWEKAPSHCEYIPKQDPGYTEQKSVFPKQQQHRLVLVDTWWYWVRMERYWLIYDGTGSVEGSSGWYLVVMGPLCPWHSHIAILNFSVLWMLKYYLTRPKKSSWATNYLGTVFFTFLIHLLLFYYYCFIIYLYCFFYNHD